MGVILFETVVRPRFHLCLHYIHLTNSSNAKLTHTSAVDVILKTSLILFFDTLLD